MTTLATLTAETRDHVHEAWLAAREQHPHQPPHPATSALAAALAQMDRACAAVDTESEAGQ